MQFNKSLKRIVVVSVVVLLLISSFCSIGISIKSTSTIKKSNSSNGCLLKIRTPSPFFGIKRPALSSLSNNNNSNISENVVISNDPGNESYPSIVMSGLNGLIVYEHEDLSRIFLRQTLDWEKDYGKNWSTALKLKVYYSSSEPDIEAVSPDLCFSPQYNEAYGTYISPKNNYAINGYFVTPDIDGDLTETETYTVDWSDIPGYPEYGFWGFQNPDIVSFDNSSTPWVITLIGSTNFTDPDTQEGPCNDSLMFSFLDFENPNYISIVWFPRIQNCRNVSITSEFGSSYIYGACEQLNGKYTDILFFKGNPDEWVNKDLFVNKTFSIPFGNLIHPHIYVDGKEIYIAAETELKGKNEIVLYYSNNEGKTWTETPRSISVNQPPVADFKVSQKRLDVDFSDNSTDEDGYITSWLWDFGDDNTSTIQNPHHNYAIPGDYTVELTVKDDDNTDNTKSMVITIDNTTPIANFSYSPLKPAAFEFVKFNDTSISYENYTNDNWTWDFGDGSNFSYVQNAIHDYFEDGIYTVKLTVKNETINKTDSFEKIIKVGLVADFTYEPLHPSVDDTIWFNDTSSDSQAIKIVDWKWNLGNGEGPIYSQNLTYQYLRPDIYYVNLTIRDELNDITSIEKCINVRANPIIPRYPRIYANGEDLYCIFSESRNLKILNSTDDGKNWEKPIHVNSLNGSVVEQNHNSYMTDNNHIIWIDNREGDKDIYSSVKSIPNIDLRIIPDSVEITKDDFPLFKSNNRIKFTVENQGTIEVTDLKVNIAIEFNPDLNKESINTSYPGYIFHLDGGAKKTFDRPLFRLTISEFIEALINFAGIINISVTVDPQRKFKDTNTFDNNFKIPVIYTMIFPRFGFFENIFLRGN